MQQLTFCLKPGSHPYEWERMWSALARLPLNGGDPCCLNPATGATWQYLCTAHTEDGWFHYFRHRHHPKTGQRESLLMPICLTDYLPDYRASAPPEPK